MAVANMENGAKELPPLREECDAEDNPHALSVTRCSKEGSIRGIFVDFLLHFQRMHDLCHLVLDERVTLIKPDSVEARQYSCSLACLEMGVDRRSSGGDGRERAYPSFRDKPPRTLWNKPMARVGFSRVLTQSSSSKMPTK
jgi:hypothetical protein